MESVILNVLPKFVDTSDIGKIAQMSKFHHNLINSGLNDISSATVLNCSDEKIIKLLRCLIYGGKTNIVEHIFSKLPNDKLRGKVMLISIEFGNIEFALNPMIRSYTNPIIAYHHSIKFHKNGITEKLSMPEFRPDWCQEFLAQLYPHILPIIRSFQHINQTIKQILFEEAAKCGSTDVFSWAQKLRWKGDFVKIVQKACKNNNVNVVKIVLDLYLKNTRFAFDSNSTQMFNAISKAQMRDMFNYFIEIKPPYPVHIFEQSIYFNDIEMLKKYDGKFGGKMYERMLLTAYEFKNMEIINYLLKKIPKLANIEIKSNNEISSKFLAIIFKKMKYMYNDQCWTTDIGETDCLEILDFVSTYYPQHIDMYLRGNAIVGGICVNMLMQKVNNVEDALRYAKIHCEYDVIETLYIYAKNRGIHHYLTLLLTDDINILNIFMKLYQNKNEINNSEWVVRTCCERGCLLSMIALKYLGINCDCGRQECLKDKIIEPGI